MHEFSIVVDVIFPPPNSLPHPNPRCQIHSHTLMDLIQNDITTDPWNRRVRCRIHWRRWPMVCGMDCLCMINIQGSRTPMGLGHTQMERFIAWTESSNDSDFKFRTCQATFFYSWTMFVAPKLCLWRSRVISLFSNLVLTQVVLSQNEGYIHTYSTLIPKEKSHFTHPSFDVVFVPRHFGMHGDFS